MGQVPKISYGIIGGGRVAKHFSHYFSLLGVPFKIWSRKDLELGLSAQAALENCHVILVLVSDSQIENVISGQSPWLNKKIVVHFSGSHNSEKALGFHPLMTFGLDLYDLETYQKICFIGEKGSKDFATVFPDLKNEHFTIPKDSKPLYHAFCVMSGNFSVLLWQNLFEELSQRWDIPSRAAAPYLEQITKNLVTHSSLALTGPLQRKDMTTIEKNRKALRDNKNKKNLILIYDAFVENYL
jgi:predicted short-subunit dehydrogenase-like oxidoreductase (DUF2520 family)